MGSNGKEWIKGRDKVCWILQIQGGKDMDMINRQIDAQILVDAGAKHLPMFRNASVTPLRAKLDLQRK